MEGNSGKWLKKLTKKEVKLLNKNVAIFAFFLLLAFLFWYLNSLGKEIKSDFRYPVTFINPPKGRVFSGDLISKLTVELKGQGYSLLKRKISGKKVPLVIDFSRVTFRREPNSNPTKYFVLSTGLTPNFKKQIGNGADVVSVSPDTIFVTFSVPENVQGKK
jgi:hypothetical protein